MQALPDLIRKAVVHGCTLSEDEAYAALCAILDEGAVHDAEIAALLTAMAQRGETVAELTGFVRAMRERITPLALTDAERAELVDTCGTGGDGKGTFNISTAAALVAAAAGAKVAKHGNRAVTSNCGSADVLEALGVPVDLAPEAAVRCLRATGFVFLYAPSAHPAMRRVQPVRRALAFRTIFNLAGPLTNPAGATAQVVGVFAADRLALVADTMAALGTRCGLVVHGSDGLDELTTAGQSHVAEVRNGHVRHYALCPRDLQLPPPAPESLRGAETARENAAILQSIFAGERGPRRDIVLLNAAAALVVAGLVPDMEQGLLRGAEALDSGAVQRTVQQLRAIAEAKDHST